MAWLQIAAENPPFLPSSDPHSHLSLGCVGGAGDAELVQAALGALHLLHNEHLQGGKMEAEH